jgi:hypothetical protein
MENTYEFKKQMLLAGEVFSKELSSSMVEIYWEILKKYKDAEVLHAFEVIFKKNIFFPKPAELINIIEKNKLSVDEKALSQANKVVSLVRKIGSYSKPRFNDEITSYIMKNNYNWSLFCVNLTEKDVVFFKKDFVALYKLYSKNENKQKKIENKDYKVIE